MNNNKVKNVKVEVPSGVSMNDKDYMNSILSCLKEMVKNYAVSLTEASNEELYNKYKEVFLRYSELQREVYEVMFKKGWYVLEKAEDIKINEKYQTLIQEFNSLEG